ncbi:hypothetical protein BGZ54_003486, partial [Gamsiella multidivaricata]
DVNVWTPLVHSNAFAFQDTKSSYKSEHDQKISHAPLKTNDQEGSDAFDAASIERSGAATPSSIAASEAPSEGTLYSNKGQDDVDKALAAPTDYWHKTLAGAPVLLELPTDRPRFGKQPVADAHHRFRIDKTLKRALKNLSDNSIVNLPTTLLAAWALVMSRLTNQDDILIAIPGDNIDSALPLRIHVAGDVNTVDMLERVRKALLDARAHQDTPLQTIIDIVQPQHTNGHVNGHAQSFQLLFRWHDGDLWQAPAETHSPQPELGLHLQEEGDEIAGELHYSASLYDAETVERHAGYLVTILQAMTAKATEPVAAIDILSQAERTLLLDTWNSSTAVYPDQQCIHHLFENQVAHTPDAIAVVFEDQAMTYGELNAQSNRLAHQLIDLGVAPDSLVGLCVERSPAMVVGILGVLKAGGAYVPLDPSHASERLLTILDDASPAVLLADKTGRSAIGEEALRSLTVVDLSLKPDGAAVNPQVPKLCSHHLAYVIYTSGSTGKPKGVMVEHQGLVNLAMTRPTVYGVTPTTRFTLFFSFSFDGSVCEWLPALSWGGAVHVLSDQ